MPHFSIIQESIKQVVNFLGIGLPRTHKTHKSIYHIGQLPVY